MVNDARIVPTRKVLVVPADLLVTELDEHFFARRGLEVVRADTGREALDAAEGFLPDLVLVGSALRDVTPRDLCERLRQSVAPPRILMITDRLIGQWDDALSADTDGHLTSPVDGEMLSRTLDALLGRLSGRASSAPAEILARLQDLSGDVPAMMVNLLRLSDVGAVVEASDELEVGTTGTLIFVLPTSGRRLSLDVVVYLRLDDIRLHFAVEFLGLTARDSRELRAFVDRFHEEP